MPYWKSKGLSRFAFFVLVSATLIFLTTPHPLVAQIAQARVILLGVTSYEDYKDIRSLIAKTEGVQTVSLETEAPGVIGLKVSYIGDASTFYDALTVAADQKFFIRQKTLPSGLAELTFSKPQGDL